jgi:Region found in RelA / SpoT proteins
MTRRRRGPLPELPRHSSAPPTPPSAASPRLTSARSNGSGSSGSSSHQYSTGEAPLHATQAEKLRRQGNMSLARMGDLAGFRVVEDFTFADQDRLAAEIARRFPADPREPKLIDRRATPSHGYRALHVAVSFDGVSIEIQTRTILQHVWANLMERLADHLGRQVRYGEPPTGARRSGNASCRRGCTKATLMSRSLYSAAARAKSCSRRTRVTSVLYGRCSSTLAPDQAAPVRR